MALPVEEARSHGGISAPPSGREASPTQTSAGARHMQPTRGIPQGDCLSMDLFCAVIQPVLTQLARKHRVVSFADVLLGHRPGEDRRPSSPRWPGSSGPEA